MVESPAGRSKKSDVRVGQVSTSLIYTPRFLVGDISITASMPEPKTFSASTSMKTPSSRDIFSFDSALRMAVNLGKTLQLPLTVSSVPITVVSAP